jgi:hypothetical protein
MIQTKKGTQIASLFYFLSSQEALILLIFPEGLPVKNVIFLHPPFGGFVS